MRNAWVLVAFSLGVAACAPPDPVTPVSAAPAPVEQVKNPVAKLRHALLARHPEDLPTREQLERFDGAPALLRQIGTTDEDIVVRARALDLVGMYDTQETVQLLLGVARDGAVPAKLRAAALLGLQRTDLTAHAEVRALYAELARGPDARLAMEAAAIIGRMPALSAERVAMEADVAVAPLVKQRLVAP